MSELVSIVGDGYVLTSPEILESHSHDETEDFIFPGIQPCQYGGSGCRHEAGHPCIRSPAIPMGAWTDLVAEPPGSEELV